MLSKINNLEKKLEYSNNFPFKIKLEDLPEYERKSLILKRKYQIIKAKTIYEIRPFYKDSEYKKKKIYEKEQENHVSKENQQNTSNERKQRNDQAETIRKIKLAQIIKKSPKLEITPEEREKYEIFSLMNSTLSRLIYAYPDIFVNIPYYN